MTNIYIYSGPTQSGKTTKLMHWSSLQKNIDGIFQPVINGKRFIYHISTRTLKSLEVENENDLIIIGKYKFSVKTFIWAQEKIIEACNKKIEWLVIDEVGPLELEGKGLEPAISNILIGRDNLSSKILFVVREKLVEKFLVHYHLTESYNKFEVV